MKKIAGFVGMSYSWPTDNVRPSLSYAAYDMPPCVSMYCDKSLKVLESLVGLGLIVQVFAALAGFIVLFRICFNFENQQKTHRNLLIGTSYIIYTCSMHNI